MRGPRFFHDWSAARRFQALPKKARSIVFYAEDSASRVHLEGIVHHLTDSLGAEISYLTSDPADRVLETDSPSIHAFCIGTGTIRTWLFMNLSADVMVMTMPDLESFQLKRSRVHPVHYVYIFHSMVSTHMIYREQAFDHFDTVLAVGPHHMREIRAAEALRKLPCKNLMEHGYGRLDAILAQRASRERDDENISGPTRVLVAPSWGPEGLLEGWGSQLIEALLASGFQVTVRPHPMTARKWPRALRALESYRGHSRYVLETDVASQESLHQSDLMISDWSGAALEYAFGLERPVLFVDVPRKVRNPEYEMIGCEPLEVSIRDEIGEVIGPRELDRIGDAVNRLCADPQAFQKRLRQARERTVYNVGRSGIVGAEAIALLATDT